MQVVTSNLFAFTQPAAYVADPEKAIRKPNNEPNEITHLLGYRSKPKPKPKQESSLEAFCCRGTVYTVVLVAGVGMGSMFGFFASMAIFEMNQDENRSYQSYDLPMLKSDEMLH